MGDICPRLSYNLEASLEVFSECERTPQPIQGDTVPDIQWFADSRRHDVPEVGGKAANLGELLRAGAPVPPGFTVPVSMFHAFMDATGLAARVTELLKDLDNADPGYLETGSAALRQAILDAPMPSGVARQIYAAYQSLSGGASVPVAVRSSATAEDLPEASFAGQQDTYLNVIGGDEVVAMVQRCWASLFNLRAIEYRIENGYTDMTVGLAAVVQVMVQSQASGVMFTRAENGDPDIIEIAAVLGLGEALVGGDETGDLYLVSKPDGTITSRTITAQGQMLVKGADPDGPLNMWMDAPAELASTQKLSDELILELAHLGRQIEDHYGSPQDVEWALGDDGQLYIVQARPITVDSQDYLLGDIELPEEPARLLVSGQMASPGVRVGRVVILSGPEDNHLVGPGDIMVAHMTSPDYLSAMRVAGAVVTEHGGRLCHAAIVSRELGLPCVVGAEGALTLLAEGGTVTVDGNHGAVFAGVAQTRVDWEATRQQQLAKLKAQMAGLSTRTKVYAISGSAEDVSGMAAGNVDGIGLLRAEFVYAGIGLHPRAAIARGAAEWFIGQLAAGIAHYCAAFGSRPVVYRLLDFKTNELGNLEGGDQYEAPEENPMLGFRGAARYLADPESFRLEIEALKRVRKEHKNLTIMIPFVRTVEELRGVLALMAEFGLGRGPDCQIWMMAELPVNALLLEDFIAEGLDGVSIGSNDLTQMVLGLDRDNPRLADIGDERNPAVLMLIEMIVRKALAAGVTIGICGQAPTDFPEITELLVRLGVTSISVSPEALDLTRQLVHSIEQELTATPA